MLKSVKINTSAKIAHSELVIIKIYNYIITETGAEFIDGIIDYLFQQNVQPIVGIKSISEPANIHTRTTAYMLNIMNRFYFIFFNHRA